MFFVETPAQGTDKNQIKRKSTILEDSVSYNTQVARR
jgi:hypothetical protein